MANYYRNGRRRSANENNPRNPKSDLFKKLTRLFSGPIVNYRTQTERDLSRRKMDKFQFRSVSGQQFKKTTHNPLDHLHSSILATQNRSERYADFNQMEYTPEIASALDIYADEMTTSSELHQMLRIDCPNQELKSILSSLYENILNIEFNLFGWCRNVCKFGDFFLYLDIDEEQGIKNVLGLPPQEVERIEGEDPTNPNYVQYQWNSGGMTFENWQVAHFRILGNDKFAPYGTSILDPARRIWRQLTLLEDAMMAYRIVRSPERRVFYIDVGAIPSNEIEQYMQKVVTQMKRNQVVNQDTGRVDLRYNPLSIEEDYYIPTRGGNTSRIETLAGGTYTGDIDDVKYLRDKLFSALKVPASYLSNSAEGEEDKATLAQKDVRFARTVQRLQRSIVTELEKVGIIHLYILGYRAKDLVSFKLSLSNPSKIAAMQELEHWKLKFDIAAGATEGYFSKQWVAKNIFSMSDDEFLRNQREMFYDRKVEAAIETASEQYTEYLNPGKLGEEGELGDDAGDDMLGGSEGEEFDLSGEEGFDDEGTEEEIPGDDLLLAEPGKRDDKIKTPYGPKKVSEGPRAKGKKTPIENYDKRGSGARKRSSRASAFGGIDKPLRSQVPGIDSTGLGRDFWRSVRGTNEGQETTYNEEQLLFETKKEISDLIAGMEKRDET